MKKYSFYLCLALLIGLFSSCSQDDSNTFPADDSNLVSFTANLPADWAPAAGTRAVPDAPVDHKLRCVLEVWTRNTSMLRVRKEQVVTGTDNINFTFELRDAGDYKALLWADYIDKSTTPSGALIAGMVIDNHYQGKYYATDSNMGLQAVMPKVGANVSCELRDAFFGSGDFTKNALPLKNFSITLARPFAKLTIAEKDKANYDYCSEVVATYTVPNRFNVANGGSSGTLHTDVHFTPDGSSVTVNGQNAYVLFSDYIFADADGTMGDIELNYSSNAESGVVFKPFSIPAGIPLKRNSVTQAAGAILIPETVPSSTVNMDVAIDDSWISDDNYNLDPKDGDYYYKDGTWSEKDRSTTSNPVIGVVFNNFKGYCVVSLKEGKDLEWSTENHDFGNLMGSPKKNTDTVLKYINEQGKSEKYPIFELCQQLRTETNNQEWHIPDNYLQLLSKVSVINPKIIAVGGTPIESITPNMGLYYWTVGTNINVDKAYLQKENGLVNTDRREKHRVRFILEIH